MTNTKDTNPKDAIGCRKPPISVVPCPVIYEIGAALLEGACKYRRHNYRVAGIRSSIYYDATMRHMMAWWEGEDLDPDSGVHHVVKAIASLVVLRDAMLLGKVTDDRPPRAADGWLDAAQDDVDDVLGRHPNPLPPYTQKGVVSDDAPDDDEEFVAPVLKEERHPGLDIEQAQRRLTRLRGTQAGLPYKYRTPPPYDISDSNYEQQDEGRGYERTGESTL